MNTFQMRPNLTFPDKNLPPQPKTQFPVPAPNLKLKEDTSKRYLVKSVSSMPLVSNMSKEELRINYLHALIQGRIPDNRMTQPQPASLPKMPQTNIPMASGPAPSQVMATGINPFMKSPIQNQLPKPLGQPTVQPQAPNIFTRQNNNFPLTNPMLSNQYQTNNQQFQPRNMFGTVTATQPAPGLMKKTSFGLTADNQQPFSAPSTNPLAPNLGFGQPAQQPQGPGIFGTQNTQFGPAQGTGVFGGQTANLQTSQVPGQITQSPSFGNLSQPLQPQPQTNIFGQQPKPSTTPGIFNAPNVSAPQGISPLNQPQPPKPQHSNLQSNIKQLLQSKPNLWNILALDPEYKNGFNQYGRIYVKSVLQRVIDQNIISQESLNKIIIEIYKQMYGPDNFQKVLDNKKKQLQQFGTLTTSKIQDLLAAQMKQKNIKSVFPDDINQLGDDFYRSWKRKPSRLSESKIFTTQNDNDDSKFRLQRRYLQVKRPTKTLDIKFKFIQVKKPVEVSKRATQTGYTQESLQKIAENIVEIRKQHRKQIMPLQEDLPDIQGFEIQPSLQYIKTLTKHELLSVPKVTISNDWGSVRFKTPISLLRKKVRDCLTINQKSVEIIDEEWKVRDAEITFRKFADFLSLQEEEQNELEEKISNWCERENYELIKVDRQRGHVIIQI